MYSILNAGSLPELGVFQNQWIILCIAVGVTAVAGFVLIPRLLKGQKSKENIDINLADNKETSDDWLQENYQFITERIKGVEKRYKSILFASVEHRALPVTIPVNVAMGLAKSGRRCLLIDVDLWRNAVAGAFGLEATVGGPHPGAVRTEFENLWVWPGHNFAQLKQMNINSIVQNALKRFDFVLINAPSLTSHPDRRQILSAAQAVFICTKATSDAKKLAELIKPLDCVVIGRIRVPQ